MVRTILLADDSPTIRKVVELTLSATSYRVRAVASGGEALERFERERPDLVVAAAGLAEPSGYEICRRVKGSAHPVPVLLLAETPGSFDQERARVCGSDGFLTKPFEPARLVEQIDLLLERGPGPLPPVERPRSERAAPTPPAAETDRVEPEPQLTPVAERPSPPGPEQDPALFHPRVLDALARAVAERLTDDVVREIAEPLVPGIVERLVRARLQELESDDDG